MIWDQFTSRQLQALDRNIPVVLNIAATEQHGGHLPLATDRLIGEHFSTLLHEAIPDGVLILPAVAIGCSDHHMDFSGTLSVSHDTFLSVVKDIIGSVLHHGFNKIVILNSHGGNQGIMQVIIEQLGYSNPSAHIIGVTWWNLAREKLTTISETGPGGTGHACEFETSMIQVIAPHLVDHSKIQEISNVPTFPWAEGDMLRGAKATYYRTMKTMTPNGVFGAPLKASAKKGQDIIESVMTVLKQVVVDLRQMHAKRT